MASAWVERRAAADGRVRYRVRFRAGGREVQHRQGGSYGSMREARIRRDYIAGELAAGRVPDLALTVPERPPTVRELADRWTASRIDVAEGTATAHRTALKRVLSRIGDLPIDAVTVDTVTGLVAALVAEDKERGTIQKSLNALRMVLEHAGVEPNVARDRRVKLPREDREEVDPPSADAVEARAPPATGSRSSSWTRPGFASPK